MKKKLTGPQAFSGILKDAQIVLAGQSASVVAGFLLNLMLIRALPTESYGVFTLFNSTLMLLAGFLHLGWTESFVRFASVEKNPSVRGSIRLFFISRVLGASALGSVAALAAAWIAQTYFGKNVSWLIWAAVGGFFTCLFSFVQNDRRAEQRFVSYSWMQAGSAALRALLVATLMFTGELSALSAMVVYTFVPVLFILGPVWKSMTFDGARLQPARIRQMNSYSFWMLISLLAVNTIGNIDSQFLAYFHGPIEIAHLGVVSRLTLPIQMVVASLTAILLPKLSAHSNIQTIRWYVARVGAAVGLVTVAMIPLAWVAPTLLEWIAGSKYSGLDSLVRLQLATQWVVLVTNPIGLALYAWGRAKSFALLNLVQVVVDLVLDWAWIPRYGAEGAVAATLCVNLIGLVFVVSSVFRELSQSQKSLGTRKELRRAA